MPYSVNGIGTGLVAASRKRVVEDCTQFDALETLMVFYCPILPYRAVHVLALWNEAADERYHSICLRFAPRLITKAFLNRWGNVLAAFGALLGGLSGYAFATMDRAVNQADIAFLAGSVSMLLTGLLFKLLWWLMDRRDERIKDLLGAHDLGSSDPFYWTSETADAVSAALLQQHGHVSLTQVISRALSDGDRSLAFYCARLAMRDPLNFEAAGYYHQLWQS